MNLPICIGHTFAGRDAPGPYAERVIPFLRDGLRDGDAEGGGGPGRSPEAQGRVAAT